MTGRLSHRGFTLLELVLVMLVICIAMAVAAPSLRGFMESSATRDAATQLAAMTQWARVQAINEGRMLRLTLDGQAGTYQLQAQERDQLGPLGTEMGRGFTLPKTLRMDLRRGDGSGVSWIDFYPDGRCEPAIIELTDARGERTTLECLSPTEPFRLIRPREQR